MKKLNKKVIISLIVGITLGLGITPLISRDNIFEELEKVNRVLNTAYRNYVDTVDAKALGEGAIRGMLKDLDPHSVYIDAEEMKRVREEFQGSFDGIGVQFDVINDSITVVAPIADGPSERLGILAGDKIVNIDNENAVGIKRTDVPKRLKGPKGTHVILDIKRSGVKELLTFDVIRDKIPLYTVNSSYMLENSDIGVINVIRFAATTHKELMEGVHKLQAKGMKRLILDLRGNPGGFLDQAFYMADEFISEGDTIVYTKARNDYMSEVKLASQRGELEDMPVIVLIDDGSASASEIVSGAIQDLDRGLIVGTTSFGKGLVQRQYPLADGSAFRLTIARYYTPSGRCIQRPYDDEEAYKKLVGRLELEEGSNIEHTIEKIKKTNETSEDTTEHIEIEVYHSRAGRPLLGGGGITPDYVVKSDSINGLSVKLRIKRVFAEYINNTLEYGKEIKAEYGEDFERFKNEYRLTDKMVKQIKKLAEDKDIEWDEDAAEEDRDYWEIFIKSSVARTVWGRDESSQIFSTIDKQLNTAKDLFDEAEKIRKM